MMWTHLSCVGLQMSICALRYQPSTRMWFVFKREFFRSFIFEIPSPMISQISPSKQIFPWYVLQTLRVQNSAWSVLRLLSY